MVVQRIEADRASLLTCFSCAGSNGGQSPARYSSRYTPFGEDRRGAETDMSAVGTVLVLFPQERKCSRVVYAVDMYVLMVIAEI